MLLFTVSLKPDKDKNIFKADDTKPRRKGVGFFARMVKAEIKNISYMRKSLCNSVHNDNEHRIEPTTIRIIKFFPKVIEDYLPICYNACVVQPTPGNGRGCLHGVILHISCDCRGRCGLPPHQQMARQARQRQQIA